MPAQITRVSTEILSEMAQGAFLNPEVFIVDDEPAIREVLSIVFERAGFHKIYNNKWRDSSGPRHLFVCTALEPEKR